MNNTVAVNEQRIRDVEHLRMLAICHYVLGGVTAAFSTVFLIHFFMGLMMLLHPDWMTGGKGPAPPMFFGVVFMLVGAFAVVNGWVLGGLQIYSGRMLQLRKRHLFSTVVAALSCMSVPFGTALGVFTLIVLARPTVKEIYGQAPSQPAIPALAASTSEAEDSVWHDLEQRSREQKQ